MVDYRWAIASFLAFFPMIGTVLSRVVLWNWSNLLSVFLGFVPPLHFYNFYLVFFKKLDGMEAYDAAGIITQMESNEVDEDEVEPYDAGVLTQMQSNEIEPQSIGLGYNRDPRVYSRNPRYFNRLPY